MTKRTEYVFAVKEYEDGTPWIMFETSSTRLDVLKDGFIGLDLREGTTFEEAQALAAKLREMVETVSYTDLSNAS